MDEASRKEGRFWPGRFITLEGIDGAGKTSHVEWMADFLRAKGKTARMTREPGGTLLGERLREMLLSCPMRPETETLLMFAARREHLTELIFPALANGEWVICDRFSDATYAYQGGGKGMDRRRLSALEQWALEDDGRAEPCCPDLTLLFDVPCEIARQRIALAGRPLDRFEQEDAQFYDRVRHAYLDRARKYAARFRVLDGQLPPEVVRRKIAECLLALDETPC